MSLCWRYRQELPEKIKHDAIWRQGKGFKVSPSDNYFNGVENKSEFPGANATCDFTVTFRLYAARKMHREDNIFVTFF